MAQQQTVYLDENGEPTQPPSGGYLDDQGNVIAAPTVAPVPSHAPTTSAFDRGLSQAFGYPIRTEGRVGEFVQQAKEHPIATAIELGAPSIVKGGGVLAARLVRPTARAAGQFFEQPLVGALMGGAAGYRTGETPGAVTGAIVGAGTTPIIGRALTKIGTPPPPKPTPVPGSRVVAPSGSPSPRPEADFHEALPKLWDDALASARSAAEEPVESVVLQASHPQGGGFTVPPAASQPPGGRLAMAGGQRSAAPSIGQGIQEGLGQSRTVPQSMTLQPSHPRGGGFTVPPDQPMTGPLVTYSPRAQRELERLSRPGAVPRSPSANRSLEAAYRELVRKPVLTTEEASLLEQLGRMVQQRAKNVGLSYAAGGRVQ